MDYQYLTTEDKLRILEEVRSSQPTPENMIKEAERNHWKSTIQAAIGLNPLPDYAAPDTVNAQFIQDTLDAVAEGI
jgi:hypothetical protein